MIQGLRTVIYPTSDLDKAKAWYAKVLETAPYFYQPFYVGFSVGGFELGLIPDASSSSEGVRAYWGVADASVALRRLLDLGATLLEDLQEVGEGIKTALVADPFGNSFGVIENPHFEIKNVR